jgi:hypothetical protein
MRRAMTCPPADQFPAEFKQHAFGDRETTTWKRYTRETAAGEGAPIGEPSAALTRRFVRAVTPGTETLGYTARCSATPRVAAKCLAATEVVAAFWTAASAPFRRSMSFARGRGVRAVAVSRDATG